MGGSAGAEGEVVVAKVAAPFTAAAASVPNVIIGLGGQAGGDFTIAETTAGCFDKDGGSVVLDAVICGMIEGRTRLGLALCGIEVFAGIYGGTDDIVMQMLEGTLDCVPDAIPGRYAKHYAPCSHNGEN